MNQHNINMSAKLSDAAVILKIADRAAGLAQQQGIRLKPIQVTMDVTAVHLNDCPLRLGDLLEADNFNFAHDIFGILNHLDRSTGKLGDCFMPRFAQPERRLTTT